MNVRFFDFKCSEKSKRLFILMGLFFNCTKENKLIEACFIINYGVGFLLT